MPARGIGKVPDASAARERRREPFRRLTELTRGGILTLDEDARILDADRAGVRLVGARSRHQILGRSLLDFVHPEARHRIRSWVRHGAVSRREFPLREAELQRLDGELHVFEVAAVPAQREARPCLYVVLRDVTQRKRLEDALYQLAYVLSHARGETFYRSVVEQLAGALAVDYALIGEIGGDGGSVAARAFRQPDGVVESTSYPLAGTPCQLALSESFSFFPCRVQRLFPTDAVLGELGAESYAGVALRDSAGHGIGVLAVLHREPLADPELLRPILEIFAARVGAELERNRTEVALGASEARYREFFEQDLAGHFITTVDGRILECNRAFARIFGFASVAEACRCQVAELYRRPGDRRRFLDRLRGHRRLGRYEAEMRRHDGTPIHVVETVAGVFDDAGELVELRGYVVDDTSRKEAEERVREQAALLDEATDAITLRDLDGRFLFWSQGARRLYGWRADEVSGRNARELLFREDDSAAETAHQALRSDGEWSGELEAVNRDRRRVIVQSRWSLVRDGSGEPRSVLAIDTDITEKRSLEEQVIRAQRMESLGTLAGGIAHELNNVLSPILMSLDLLKRRLQGAHEQAILGTVEAAALHGRDMIRQVLWFARGAQGERRAFPLGHLIQEVVNILRDTFPRSIEVTSAHPPDLLPVSGDPTQLYQVLMNLAVNARDAMAEGGRLTIEACNARIEEGARPVRKQAAPGSYVRLTVADTGVGIPRRHLERIYEPFFTTKGVARGTGLGLTTVHSIVTAHGGFVEVTSRERAGTRFAVYLPAAATLPEPCPEAPRREVPAGRGQLILVVDDDAGFRSVAEEVLADHGYRTLAADDGAEGAILFARHRDAVAAVLVDVAMPNIDGPGMIRVLRGVAPQLRIIATSGLLGPEEVRQRLPRVDAFLQKPFTAGRLVATLAEILPA